MATDERLKIAEKAILYFLKRVRDDEHVGWWCGWGTQVFREQVQAYAALTGEAESDVEKAFEQRNARDPDQCRKCGNDLEIYCPHCMEQETTE